MPSDRQKRLAEEIIANSLRPIKERKNKRDLVVSSGYGIVTGRKHTHLILKQKGLKEALDDFGFNEDNAKKVVSEIMLDERKDPNARLRATDQVFKVRGTYAPEVHRNLNVVVNLNPQEIEKLDNLLDEAKASN